MDFLTGWETTERVLATAQETGFNPSKKQRKDWRRVGLLPEAVNPHGRGRGKGTALYPPGTGELLTAICRHSKPKKRLADLAFAVWWDGYEVNPDLIRKRLSAHLQDAQEWHDLPEHEMRDRVGTALAKPRLTEPWCSIRREIGREAFETMVLTLFDIYSGRFSNWPHANASSTFLAGTGLDRATSDDFVGKPWLDKYLRKPLRDLSAAIQPDRLQVALETCTDELCRARDELQALMGLLEGMRTDAEARFGQGALGLHRLPHPEDDRHRWTAPLLLAWLALRRQEQIAQGFAELMETAESSASRAFFMDLIRRTTEGLPRRLAPSGSAAYGEETSTCAPSLAPTVTL